MRKKYIDILRLIALFYMFFQHGVLVLLKNEQNSGFTNFLFEIVPFCSALFLFVAGFSLTISANKYENKIQFIFRLILRGVILILSSSFLFIIENGIQFPDFIFSSGILNTIGIFLLLSILIFIFENKNLRLILTFLITILLTGITIYLDINKIYLYPFNYAYESISPTIIFGFIGILIGLLINDRIVIEKKIDKIIASFILLAGFVIILIFSIKYGFLKSFYSENGRYFVHRIYDTKFLLFDFLKSNEKLFYVSTWNFNTISFITAIGTTFLLFGMFYLLEPLFKKVNYAFIIPGKYAFFNYFFHFIVIAIVVLNFGYNAISKIQFYIFLIFLFVLSFIFSNYLEFKKNKNIYKKSF